MQAKHNAKRLIWLGALALAAGGGWWWWGFDGKNGNGKTGYKTVALERGDIMQTVTANGALGALTTVAVGSEVSGKIVELLADYNSAVTNGQVLARLDASAYERQLEQSEAELESARAALKLAEANFRRAQELRELELVSQADFDQSEAALAQAKASLRMKEASLSKMRVDLEKTTIYSPMDGVVISRAVDVGQTVAASLNAPTLFTIAQDLRKMRIEAQISEADVGGVAEGQEVSFTVDAFPTQTFTGTVSQLRFEPVTNQNVVNYIAIVDVDNADLKLRPGMTANASVTTAKRVNVRRLPNAALRFRPPDGARVAAPEPPPGRPAAEKRKEDGRGDHAEAGPRGEGRSDRAAGQAREVNGSADAVVKTVYVLDEQGGLRAQPVELGISDGTWTEVLGPGPTEGARLATGVQTAAEKEKAANSGSSSPFMPRRPRGGGPPPM